MSKFEDIIAASKVSELLHKKDEDKVKTTILWVLAIIGVVTAVATPIIASTQRIVLVLLQQ